MRWDSRCAVRAMPGRARRDRGAGCCPHGKEVVAELSRRDVLMDYRARAPGFARPLRIFTSKDEEVGTRLCGRSPVCFEEISVAAKVTTIAFVPTLIHGPQTDDHSGRCRAVTEPVARPVPPPVPACCPTVRTDLLAAAAIFLGLVFCCFRVQPIIAQANPPVVRWDRLQYGTTCLLFFSEPAFSLVILRAHPCSAGLTARHQKVLHIALIAVSLAALPSNPGQSGGKPARE